METSTLRWMIIIIGVLVLASIFLFGNPDKKRQPRASRKKESLKSERREPTLDPLDEPEDSRLESSAEGSQGELPIDAVGAAAEHDEVTDLVFDYLWDSLITSYTHAKGSQTSLFY